MYSKNSGRDWQAQVLGSVRDLRRKREEILQLFPLPRSPSPRGPVTGASDRTQLSPRTSHQSGTWVGWCCEVMVQWVFSARFLPPSLPPAWRYVLSCERSDDVYAGGKGLPYPSILVYGKRTLLFWVGRERQVDSLGTWKVKSQSGCGSGG